MCTGACLRAAALYWGELGLGPDPHASPPAGPALMASGASQPPRISSPRCGCYTYAYAYDMREYMHDLQKLQVINNQINFYPIVTTNAN